MPIVPHIVLQIFVALVDLAIGLYVLFKDPRSIVNRAFCVFASGIALWAASVALLGYTQWPIFMEIGLYAGHIMVAGIVLLAETFPEERRIEKSFFLIFIPLGLVTVLTPFHVFIRSVGRSLDGSLQPVNGPLFPLLVVVVGAYIVLSIFLFIRRYRRLQGIAKVQMRYLLAGAGIFIMGMFVADLLLPAFGIFQFNLLGPVLSIVFTGLTAYAIVRHQFMDIRVVIKRTISYTLVILCVACVFFISEFIVEKFFYSNDEVVDILAAAMGALVFARIRRFFEDLTDRIFFRGDYNYSRAVQELGPLLAMTIELEKLIASMRDFLERTVKPRSITVVLEDDKGGLEASERDVILLMEMLNALPRKPIFMQEIDLETDADAYSSVADVSKKMGIAAIIPFFSKDEHSATLLLGEKRSDEIFSLKDKELLAVLSHQAGMAIENARLYEKIRRYNEELERRVEERTGQIKNMYEAQARFLTDISHELQTPIAIMQGNLELMDSGTGASSHDAMRIVRGTLEGMSHLIANLLGIAKLNFSKNKFYKDPIDVERLLEEVHGDCFILSKNKEISFSFSSEALVVSGDRRKLKEVFFNLLSNAFAHTLPGGSVFLVARKTMDNAEIVVTDTGTGIAPENIPYMFERFYKIRDEASKGNGIGLNICKQIIEAHHGTISVESEEGRGSSFIIHLPLAS